MPDNGKKKKRPAYKVKQFRAKDTVHVPHAKGYKVAVKRGSPSHKAHKKTGLHVGTKLGYNQNLSEDEHPRSVKNYRNPLKKKK